MPQSAQVVICGAGIAGIATAYQLAVKHGLKEVVLLEQGDPLSLTSDKSTEAYRNWWPGPDQNMIAFMNRSIELLEEIALESGNRINLNRRGYLYATADESKIPLLTEAAQDTASKGAGPLRIHYGRSNYYQPSPSLGFDLKLDGADLITDPSIIQQHFPYLNKDTKAVLHARKAGWLGAQQLGMFMLEKAREQGVQLIRGGVVDLDSTGGKVRAVSVKGADGSSFEIQTSCFVNAAGPMQKAVGAMLGIEIPVFAEQHMKMSFAETLGAVPREAPMLIWTDELELPWSLEERQMLLEDGSGWLLERLPSGVHCRPDGHSGHTLIVLYNLQHPPVEPTFPLKPDPNYAEIALRGMSVMVPGLGRYLERIPKPYVDGGYYVKTQENRPLICPLGVGGAYLIGALSGFGVMASCAAAELLAAYITGSKLPEYAPAFHLNRYQDPKYVELLENWGDGAQL